ncbi:MAG: TRAP transporter small permease subunit [Celeribacter marinus]
MRLSSAYLGLQRLFRLIAMVALAGLVLITAVDVIGRVLFDAPLGFAYELIGVLLGLAVYSGLISVNATDQHIRIDLFETVLGRWPRFDIWRSRFSLLLEVAFFAVLAAYIVRQSLVLLRWHETFLFINIEKWMPLLAFGSLAFIAMASTLLRISPGLRRAAKGTK